MGYQLTTNDGTFEVGDYAKFTVFETSLATKPFSLVQRDFNLKQFFVKNPNTGGKNNDGRVIDALCRIDAVLKDKRDHNYALLTPILPLKKLYDIVEDSPEHFMQRIEKWAIQNKRTVNVGKLTWDATGIQKFYECIDVLLNTAKLRPEELATASRIQLADNTSPVRIVNPEELFGHTYDLRTGQPDNIHVIYEQTNEHRNISIGTLASLYKADRITNGVLKIKGSFVTLDSYVTKT